LHNGASLVLSFIVNNILRNTLTGNVGAIVLTVERILVRGERVAFLAITTTAPLSILARRILTGVKAAPSLTVIYTQELKKGRRAKARELFIGPNTSSSGKNNMERNFPMDGLFIT